MANGKVSSIEELLRSYTRALEYSGNANSFTEYKERRGIDYDTPYYEGMRRATIALEAGKVGSGATAERLYSSGLMRSGYADYLQSENERAYQNEKDALERQKHLAESRALGGYLSYLEDYTKEEKSAMNDLRSRLIASGVVSEDVAYKIGISSGLSDRDARALGRDVYGASRERITKEILNMVVTYRLGTTEAGILAREYGLSAEDAAAIVRSAAELRGESFEVSDEYLMQYLSQYK